MDQARACAHGTEESWHKDQMQIRLGAVRTHRGLASVGAATRLQDGLPAACPELLGQLNECRNQPAGPMACGAAGQSRCACARDTLLLDCLTTPAQSLQAHCPSLSCASHASGTGFQPCS